VTQETDVEAAAVEEDVSEVVMTAVAAVMEAVDPVATHQDQEPTTDWL